MRLHTRGYATTLTVGIVGSCGAAWLGRSLGWIQGPTGAGGIVFPGCGAALALALCGIVPRRLGGGAGTIAFFLRALATARTSVRPASAGGSQATCG